MKMAGCNRVVVVVLLVVMLAVPVVECGLLLRLLGMELEEDLGHHVCGPQLLQIATPPCKVVETRSEYELRKYTKTEIWVETLVANSSFESATSTGFTRCFDYISGKNSEGMRMEMTSPIHFTPHANGYKVAFFLATTSDRFKSVEDLPAPQDSEVHLSQLPKGAVKAVVGPFGGFPTDKDYEAKFAELKRALENDGIEYDEKTVLYAGYSGPFQFRNRMQEVHVNIIS